jgi:replication factor A2
MPLTIKQILNAEHKDSKFRVDGKEITQLTIVALVIHADLQSTGINYVLDDGTGKISCRFFLDAEDMSTSKAVHREGVYVRVYGNARVFGNQRSVFAFQVMEVKDFNELTYHTLDVITTHLKNTKGYQPLQGMVGQSSNNSMRTGQQGSMPLTSSSNSNINNYNSYSSNSNSNSNMNMGMKGQSIAMENDNSNSGMDPLQKMVLKIFQTDTSAGESGTSIQTVMSKIPQASADQIRKAVETLSEEGHLYSTIDEDHFKCTDANA